MNNLLFLWLSQGIYLFIYLFNRLNKTEPSLTEGEEQHGLSQGSSIKNCYGNKRDITKVGEMSQIY